MKILCAQIVERGVNSELTRSLDCHGNWAVGTSARQAQQLVANAGQPPRDAFSTPTVDSLDLTKYVALAAAWQQETQAAKQLDYRSCRYDSREELQTKSNQTTRKQHQHARKRCTTRIPPDDDPKAELLRHTQQHLTTEVRFGKQGIALSRTLGILLIYSNSIFCIWHHRMNHERLYVGVNQNHTRLTNLFTLCSSLRSKRGLPPFGRDGHPSLDGTSIQPQQQPCQMSLTMAHMDAEVRLSTCLNT